MRPNSCLYCNYLGDFAAFLLFSVPVMTLTRQVTSCACGFSLVEVLIALFVLAIGVIGSTGLQATALQTAQDSTYQTVALQLAAEMAQHLRALEQSASPAAPSSSGFQLDFQSNAPSRALPSAAGCYQSACTTSDLHTFYLSEWLYRLDQALPEARVRICQDAAPWNVTHASLDWHCTASLSTEVVAATVIKIGWQGRQRAGLLASGWSQRQGFGPMVVVPVALGDKGLT